MNETINTLYNIIHFELFRNRLIISLFSHNIDIRFYGLSYIAAFLLIHYLVELDLKRRNISLSSLFHFQFIGLIGGYLGARLWHKIMIYLEYNIPIHENFCALLQPGLAVQGGLIGAIIFGILFLLFSRKIKCLPDILDSYATYFPLGILIVRSVGNYANEEFTYPGFFNIPMCFCLAFAEGLLLFIVIYLARCITKRKLIPSSMFLIFYSMIRFITDFYRNEPVYIATKIIDFKISHIVCIFLFLSGICLFFFAKSRKTLTKQRKNLNN